MLRGASLDEPGIGCRYLLARCVAPAEGSREPDVGRTTWRPPHEDPHDRDPIVSCYWCPVSDVLDGRSKLREHRCQLLRRAVAQLRHAGDFMQFGSGDGTERPTPSAIGELPAAVAAEQAEPSKLSAVEKEVLKLAKKVRKLDQHVETASELRRAFADAFARLPADSDVRAKVADVVLDKPASGT